jgi:oligopeptide/dipeptide ABC transporter ATP-binding protein
VVRHVSDRVAVMYLGKIAEIGETGDVYATGRHPYTQALLSAAPAADPDEAAARQRIILVGDVPSPLNPPSGCRFHPRCPKAQERCTQVEPALEVKFGDPENHRAACHFPVETGEDLTRAADLLRHRAEPSLG